MIVVFIAGVSASGKTTLTEKLLSKLKQQGISCLSIKMDDYYKEIPFGMELVQYKKTTNFDNPSALDLPLLKEHIIALEKGEHIDKPVFSFATERRTTIESIEPPAVLLIEGTASLLFSRDYVPELKKTYKIFIEAEHKIVVDRRISRDRDFRGYADEKSIRDKDEQFVWPTFLRLIEPTKSSADIIINNNKAYDADDTSHPFVTSAETIMSELKSKLQLETQGKRSSCH